MEIYVFIRRSSTKDADQEHEWQQWCRLIELEL